MATPRKSLPRHAEDARCEAVALVLHLQDHTTAATEAVVHNNKVGALAALASIHRDLGRTHVVLLQQGNSTYGKETV